MNKKLASLVAFASIVGALLPTVARAQVAPPTVTNEVVTSSAGGIAIAITVFKPEAASAQTPVPVILHSHGWGGSRETATSGLINPFLDAGFGVVSIDQRGFGESGGEANVEDPELEAEDIQSVIDHVATFDWVQKDLDAEGNPIANDPVLGAIGGSYGGGYQTMTALDEVAELGYTRFNALAPEITWYDLNESLAPEGVVRTAWTAALYAAGNAFGKLPTFIHEAFAWGVATGTWPDGTAAGQPVDPVPNIAAIFATHGPRHFADQDKKLDIPVLQRQGQNDTLFNLNQGLKIFRHALTPEAQSHSLFVGYNGGHVLPGVFPASTVAGEDACSGGFTALTVKFFKAAFAGEETGNLLPARYNLTDYQGTKCLRFNDTTEKVFAVNEDLDPTGSNGMVSTTGVGAPIALEIADGPITVTGIPTLEGDVYSGPEARVFFGLSVGTSPADAKVIQNNMMPLHTVLPGMGDGFKIELPGIGAEIPAGQKLFLTISPVSDIFFGHGSRVPSGMLLTGLKLRVPTI